VGFVGYVFMGVLSCLVGRGGASDGFGDGGMEAGRGDPSEGRLRMFGTQVGLRMIEGSFSGPAVWGLGKGFLKGGLARVGRGPGFRG